MMSLGGFGGRGDYQAPAKRPPAVICHICGRQYGSASIAIHLKQCEKKFLDEEAKKPKPQRRALPDAPNLDEIKKMSPDAIEAHNENAFRNFNDNMLERCEYCGRTFLPEKLTIHNRSCTADHPARRVGEARLPTGGAPTTYGEQANQYAASVPLPSASAGSSSSSASISSPSRPERRSSNGGTGRPMTAAAGSGAGARAPSSPAGAAADSRSGAAAISAASSNSRPASRATSAPRGVAVTDRRGSGVGASGRVSAGARGTRTDSDAAWKAQVSQRLSSLAERLAYLQETVLTEIQDIQGEICELADVVAGHGDISSHGDGEDGKEGEE